MSTRVVLPYHLRALARADGEVSVEATTTREVLDALERVGVSYTEVVELLETEGVDKFEKSWTELLATVQGELDKVAGSRS